MKQTLKKLVGPIYRQKEWLERVKYLGRSVADGEAGHQRVRDLIASGPVAIGKIGESELRGLICYLQNRDADGDCKVWDKRSERLYTNAGVFPNLPEAFSDFGRAMVDTLPDMDGIAVWYNRGEAKVIKSLSPQAKLVYLSCIEPHLWDNPWINLCEGKRVLAISPFAKTIEHQHQHLSEVWQKKPAMAVPYEIATIETPLCAALVESPYASWQAGLDQLKAQMSAIDFDIAIIGAGAWSLPLAVHAKRIGKVGIHLGGPAQLIFGILGQRWEAMPNHSQFFNEHWVRPDSHERPDTFKKIEGGCYW